MELNFKSFQLFTYVVPKAESADWKFPSTEDKDADVTSSPNYAGLGSTFGGKENCPNCKENPLMWVRIDITAALESLSLSRYDAVVKFLCRDEYGDYIPFEDTKLPTPTIQGNAWSL